MVRTEAAARGPRLVPQGKLRTVANWASPGEFGSALTDWDTSLVAVRQTWDQLEEDDRSRVDPAWDPYE